MEDKRAFVAPTKEITYSTTNESYIHHQHTIVTAKEITYTSIDTILHFW